MERQKRRRPVQVRPGKRKRMYRLPEGHAEKESHSEKGTNRETSARVVEKGKEACSSAKTPPSITGKRKRDVERKIERRLPARNQGGEDRQGESEKKASSRGVRKEENLVGTLASARTLGKSPREKIRKG